MATTTASIIGQARTQLQDLGALDTPALPTITPQGTTGATTYSYKIVAKAQNGVSAASAAGSTATGNATLSTTNKNLIAWVAIAGATVYDVYRTVGGATQGLIATAGNVTSIMDTGLTGDASTAPAMASGTIFWSADELLQIALDGYRDMWRAIIDLHQWHYATVDITNVSLAAAGTTLTGVPADVFRVLLIEPRDTTSAGTYSYVTFKPTELNSKEFVRARALNVSLASTLPLRFVYIPTLGTLTADSNNPIPGESDKAIKAWIIAHASAKQRDDNSPDPNWLSVYATEKGSILKALAPRQEQEPRYVRGAFDDEDDDGYAESVVLYAIVAAGSPVAAPTIYVTVT